MICLAFFREIRVEGFDFGHGILSRLLVPEWTFNYRREHIVQ